TQHRLGIRELAELDAHDVAFAFALGPGDDDAALRISAPRLACERTVEHDVADEVRELEALADLRVARAQVAARPQAVQRTGDANAAGVERHRERLELVAAAILARH